MLKEVETTAKTVEMAIEKALQELNISEEDAIIEVLDEGGSGLLGFGRRSAKVRVSVEVEEEEVDETLQVDSDSTEEQTTESGAEHDEDFLQSRKERELQAVEFIAKVLNSLGIHGRMASGYEDDQTLHIEVTGEDLGNAIGRKGETLNAIQYLTTLAINHKTDDYVRVQLDIGGYRRRRHQSLMQNARRFAQRVARSGRRYRLDPMGPAERRQIHMALQDFEGVTTYSEGEEPDRRVVIAPER